MEIRGLLVWFLCFTTTLHSCFSTDQPYRTGFHFQPPKNWMNDPNGPMYYNGVYHLFYQYNPYAATWGNISWGHSVSYDLINWIHLRHALSPTHPFDINGCWTGSATFVSGGKPVILFTGSDASKHQVQNLALPKDPSDSFLREWVKYPRNPVIGPTDGIDPQNFRDPTTAWKGRDGIWRVLVGNQMENGYGAALLYRSKDFVTWERSNLPLHSSSKTRMWECPDFFPIGDNDSTKYVLKASFDDHDHYILGSYDSEKDKFTPDADFLEDGLDLRYDYGNFYASKTFFDDSTSRRILWGWILESDSKSDDTKKGWAGLQSIPRSILLDKTRRQLIQWPVRELEKLRSDNVTFQNKELEGGSVMEVPGVTASQADVEVYFEVQKLEEAEKIEPEEEDPLVLCARQNATLENRKIGPFGLLVLASEDLRERTAVFFRVYRSEEKHVVLMCSDQTRSSLTEDVKKPIYGAFLDIDPRIEKISLRSLIDRSVIESFGGEGKICVTARAYPETAIEEKAKLYVFNNGSAGVTISSLHAWSIKNAHITSIQSRRKSKIN